jgi:hypothetical protein
MAHYTNEAEDNHPLEGHTFVFNPDKTPWEGDVLDNDIVIGNGMEYTVVKVFHTWNGVEDLSMMYVFVPETMHYTHISFGEGGLT